MIEDRLLGDPQLGGQIVERDRIEALGAEGFEGHGQDPGLGGPGPGGSGTLGGTGHGEGHGHTLDDSLTKW